MTRNIHSPAHIFTQNARTHIKWQESYISDIDFVKINPLSPNILINAFYNLFTVMLPHHNIDFYIFNKFLNQ